MKKAIDERQRDVHFQSTNKKKTAAKNKDILLINVCAGSYVYPNIKS